MLTQELDHVWEPIITSLRRSEESESFNFRASPRLLRTEYSLGYDDGLARVHTMLTIYKTSIDDFLNVVDALLPFLQARMFPQRQILHADRKMKQARSIDRLFRLSYFLPVYNIRLGFINRNREKFGLYHNHSWLEGSSARIHIRNCNPDLAYAVSHQFLKQLDQQA